MTASTRIVQKIFVANVLDFSTLLGISILISLNSNTKIFLILSILVYILYFWEKMLKPYWYAKKSQQDVYQAIIEKDLKSFNEWKALKIINLINFDKGKKLLAPTIIVYITCAVLVYLLIIPYPPSQLKATIALICFTPFIVIGMVFRSIFIYPVSKE